MALDLLVRVVVMVSVVFAAAWGVTAVMRWRSAASRHAVWTAAVVLALALPAAALFGPVWELSVPVGTGDASTATAASAPPATEAIAVTDAEPAGVVFETPDFGSIEALAPALGKEPAVAPPLEAAPQASPAIAPAAALAALWAVGFAAWIARLVAGFAWTWWTGRRAQPVTDPAWEAALADAAARLGLRTRVVMRLSERVTMPSVHGVWRATLLLPPHAAGWTPERRQIVLLHELAHVLRRDVVVQVVARVASAVHWFNPLVHLGIRCLRLEQERACDDVVLASGSTGPEYADHLVELARQFQPSLAGAVGWGAVGVARPSQLETRLRAILDTGADRRGLSWRARAVLVTCVTAAAVPLGALRVVTAAAAQGEPGVSATAAPRPVSVAPRAVAREVVPADLTSAPRPVSVFSGTAVPVATPAQAVVSAGSAPSQVVAPPVVTSAAPSTLLVSAVQAATAPEADDTQRRAVAALRTAVDDADENVRLQAVRALAGLGGSEAVDALTRALQDASAMIRAEAAQSLGAIAHRAADRESARMSVERAREEAAREQVLAGRQRELEERLAQAQAQIEQARGQADQRSIVSAETAEFLKQQLDQSNQRTVMLELQLQDMRAAVERAQAQVAEAEERLRERALREREAADAQR